MRVAILIAAVMASYTICTPSLASNDSRKIGKLEGLKPAQADIVTIKDRCYTTSKKTYSVSAVSRESAYPKCNDNYIIQQVNLETEQHFLDVITKVNVLCCPQKTAWLKNKEKSSA